MLDMSPCIVVVVDILCLVFVTMGSTSYLFHVFLLIFNTFLF